MANGTIAVASIHVDRMLTGVVNVAHKVGLVRFTVGAALGREATMMLTGFDVLGADAS